MLEEIEYVKKMVVNIQIFSQKENGLLLEFFPSIPQIFIKEWSSLKVKSSTKIGKALW